jgi:RimJ/RimL family protein N-acetyltransferase
MFELWRDPAVCEYSGAAVDSLGAAIDLPAPSQAESDRLLDYWLERARIGSGFRWAAVTRDEDDFIGAVGFNSLGPNAEYAYHLLPTYWGRGLAAEASRSALTWVFSAGADSVECHIEPANLRSIKLARQLAFREPTQAPGVTSRYILSRDIHAAQPATVIEADR